jgi:hypothetical protein
LNEDEDLLILSLAQRSRRAPNVSKLLNLFKKKTPSDTEKKKINK